MHHRHDYTAPVIISVAVSVLWVLALSVDFLLLNARVPFWLNVMPAGTADVLDAMPVAAVAFWGFGIAALFGSAILMLTHRPKKAEIVAILSCLLILLSWVWPVDVSPPAWGLLLPVRFFGTVVVAIIGIRAARLWSRARAQS